jgi:uncharacterized protein YkwD
MSRPGKTGKGNREKQKASGGGRLVLAAVPFFLSTLLLAGCDLAGGADPARELLDRVNRMRGTARTCGTVRFEAAPPLAWNDRLAAAARRHSRDLAAHGRSSHTGRDGSTPAGRIAEAGYAAAVTGEVVAVGSARLDEVMDGFLASPGHCAALMDPRFTETGAAVAGAHYWTMALAAPAG